MFFVYSYKRNRRSIALVGNQKWIDSHFHDVRNDWQCQFGHVNYIWKKGKSSLFDVNNRTDSETLVNYTFGYQKKKKNAPKPLWLSMFLKLITWLGRTLLLENSEFKEQFFFIEKQKFETNQLTISD